MIRFVEKVEAITTAFAAAGVPHAFGGALALAFCVGAPRATADIDINVFVGAEEAAAVLAALPPGITRNATSARTARSRDQVRVWWDDTPITLFFTYHPLQVDAARHVRSVPFGEVPLPVLSCTHLAVLKVIFDRTRDWADLEAMTDADSVDRIRALQWLESTLGADAPPVARFRRLDARPIGSEPNLRHLLERGSDV
jgi:hypothetical protein